MQKKELIINDCTGQIHFGGERWETKDNVYATPPCSPDRIATMKSDEIGGHGLWFVISMTSMLKPVVGHWVSLMWL